MKLICYLSNGYPTISASIKTVDYYLEAGCDVIEIDLPSRNPYLDSEFIQARMKAALETCDEYEKYMEGMAEIRRRNPNTSFIILAYEETIEEIGGKRFIDFCLEHEFLDVIYIGSSNPALQERCMQQGLRISTYIPFHMPEKELALARRANGFIYLQSKSSGQMHPIHDTLETCIKYLRNDDGIAAERPIYCGVGVSSPEDVTRVKESGGDGAFVGSAVLKLQNNPTAMVELISKLKSAAGRDID